MRPLLMLFQAVVIILIMLISDMSAPRNNANHELLRKRFGIIWWFARPVKGVFQYFFRTEVRGRSL